MFLFLNKNSNLDFDLANSAFSLLFLFAHDNSLEEHEQRDFDTIVTEAFCGLSLPKQAKIRLKNIYNQVKVTTPSLESTIRKVLMDFGTKRSLLVSLLQLILRTVAEDGMVSKRHGEELRELLTRFNLSEEELEDLSDQERAIISLVLKRFENQTTECLPSLNKYFSILQCEPHATDEELKSAYRILAKRYHPDSTNYSLDDLECSYEHRELKFKEINFAYEEITKIRGSRQLVS